MRHPTLHPYTAATAWALALILNSWLTRGMAIGAWLDAGLYLGFGAWLARTLWRPRAR